MKFREFIQNEGLFPSWLSGKKDKGQVAGGPPAATPQPVVPPPQQQSEPQTEKDILQAASDASGYAPGVITGASFANQGGFSGTKWRSWGDFMNDPTPVMQKLHVLDQVQQQGAEEWGAGIGHRGLRSNS